MMRADRRRPTMKHIMILEEDRKLNRRLHDALIQDGFTFSRCGSIDEAWEVLRSQNIGMNTFGQISGRSEHDRIRPGASNCAEHAVHGHSAKCRRSRDR